MGLHRWWQVTLVIVCLFSSSLVEGLKTYSDRKSLDSFLRMQANEEIKNPKTGVLYNVSLPSNLTGMEVSVVRLRSFSLWSRGMNYSFFNLPPRIMSRPSQKRITILYENLGNCSSHYYNVPNHTMVAPVFGVMAYSSSESALVDEKINFTIHGDPIKIWFPLADERGRNHTPLCAKFTDNGLVKFKNMTKPYVCEVHRQGHYTLVIPSFPFPDELHTHSHGRRFTTWWVLGFAIGFIGLVVLGLILLALVMEVKKRKIRKMEKNSAGEELFDTFWIGETKLPLASSIRTQPILEN
ncbi:hypothetical protein LR48_Vigan707s002200 [Vigna angularis]|uniref:Legume lectin domain-containing protein n=2 Tax=Phaseolus angularis TaxID=3914 RepID=A0A0L9TFX4_PHAAN|nr:uncharacterized protein LOC108322614 [Vigna angularis]KAG2380249.1 uncharacterized protein HKW66_Vig0170280 [Vigna angularis]KOM29490.1 hypothetical protein LR48_Vigan707s002200 [Vigna angularis]BAT98039.1 hypothetical protein VIGAN_09164500 [Vigna angularis var. angularis]